MSTDTALKTGKVKFYNKEKAFGFIIDNDDRSEIFFHKNDCKGTPPGQDDDVEYFIGDGKKGPCAKEVSAV